MGSEMCIRDSYQSDEIGQMLKMNPTTVRSRKKRALEKMRVVLQEMEV